MKKFGLSCALMAALALPAWAAAADLPGLPDQMKLPAYGHTVHDLFDQDTTMPDWFKGFLQTGQGTAMPGKAVTLTDHHREVNYELYGVCKTDNCHGNVVYVLFEPGGGKAWALSIAGGGHTRYYNRPSAGQRRALQHASQVLEKP